MARGKKKETLTPEERLQAALVPDWEQPYKVPANWCWTALKHISSHISDGSHNPPKDSGTGIPLLSATNIHDHLIDIDSAVRWITEDQWIIENQRTKIETNDVLLTIVASIGRTAVVKNEQFALQRSVAVIKPKINSEFLSYYFEAPYIQQFMLDNAKGTAQKGFYLNSLAELFCCVPPLPEQQRIVDRIESLFAKLDEAKQKAQDALDSFETRKAAILHKAFTGELTAQWRKEHGVGMESWEKASLGKYVDSQYGYTESASWEQVGPKFLRITDIQDGVVDWANVPFCKISDTDFERYAVSQNDIMIARTGATTGKSYLIVDEVKAVFASYLIRIKIKSPKLQPQYLYGFMQSQLYWGQITEFSAGIAQPGVNAKKLKEIILSIPSVPEQTEIVRILDDLLAKEQQAKEAAEGVLEQIDLIKKAILARAFRGELGTNDPSEESAIKLLERSFSETIESEKVRHKQVSKQRAEVVFVPKTIMEALSTGVRLTPESLKRETELPIDDFYARLKELIDNGSVVESRENGESYLEAANENRQAENQ